MIVKVCGITSLADAEVAVEAGASALGFNFYPLSPRAIAPEAARTIIEQLPPEVIKAGIFVNVRSDAVAAIMEAAGLNVAQVIGETPKTGRVWKVHRVTGSFLAGQLDDPRAEAFLLDTPSTDLFGGTGHTFDWSLARVEGKRIVIAGGLDPSNVADAIRACQPWGVDACSRLERTPGRKDPERVRAFVAAALNV